MVCETDAVINQQLLSLDRDLKSQIEQIEQIGFRVKRLSVQKNALTLQVEHLQYQNNPSLTQEKQTELHLLDKTISELESQRRQLAQKIQQLWAEKSVYLKVRSAIISQEKP